jgi:hypothetical protein
MNRNVLILASELTPTGDGDASLVGPLLDQIMSPNLDYRDKTLPGTVYRLERAGGLILCLI